MAIYYLGMKTFGRSGGKRGSRATSAAAYRAGERIRDERTGAVYDHHRRRDVMHKEVVLPAKLARAGSELTWARHRASLWNAAEHAEGRRNARVAREFVVALPHELTHGQRTLLTRRFAQELADRYGNAIDIAIHAPRGDPRNFHAHLLATTREITPDGLGPKTTLERSGTERHRLGLPRWREETRAIRERWATLANQQLENAHIAARVVPGAERSPRAATPRVPLMAFHIERRGERSFLAERVRAAYRARLASAATDSHRGVTSGREPPERPNEGRIANLPERANLAARLRARAREAWVALSAPLRQRFQSPAIAPSGPHMGRQSSAPLAREDVSRNGRGPAVVPDELARQAAREWLRQYGKSAGIGPASPRTASQAPALTGPDRAVAPDREPEQPHERQHEHDYGLGL